MSGYEWEGMVDVLWTGTVVLVYCCLALGTDNSSDLLRPQTAIVSMAARWHLIETNCRMLLSRILFSASLS